MRTGLLTFHRGPNYGGYLQAWHLREAIRRLGHDCEIINYQNPTLGALEKPSIRSLHPARLRHLYRFWRKCRPFAPLVDSFSPDPFTTCPDQVDWRRFDHVIVGSDVVWDYQTPQFGQDPCYFGAHPSQQGVPFSSYAASCGPARPDEGVPDWVGTGLARFQTITVRDETTRDLVRRACGREAEIVVDPTWLNPDPPPARSIAPGRPYVLVYGSPLDTRRAGELRTFARSKGWQIVGAASSWKHCDVTLNGFDPFQWVDLFHNASAVVTSTLHGLLYSIKAGKPFLMVSLPAAASKSATVLKRINALNRVVSPQDPFGPQKLSLLEEDLASALDHAWISRSRQHLQISDKI